MIKNKKRMRAFFLAMAVMMVYAIGGFAQPDTLLTTSTSLGLLPPASTTTVETGRSAGGDAGSEEQFGVIQDPLIETSAASSSADEKSAEVQQTAHHTLPKILVTLMLILMVAKIGGDLMERVGQPAVLGELLFGIVLGNIALFHIPFLEDVVVNVFHDREVAVFVTLLAELGVILLLFEVGLESTLGEMISVGPTAFIVAILGVLAPIGLGYLAGMWFLPEEPWVVNLFLGAVLAATSVGITARVLKDIGRMEMRESKIILGAAVIDDILGLVVLAVASGAVAAMSTGTSMSMGAIGIIVLKAVGFFAAAIVLGRLISPKMYRLATYLRVKGVLLSLTLGWCFLLAWLGSLVGVAPIVGAFAAGLVLEDATFQDWHGGTTELEELLRPITGFLVPVFFVHTGMSVQLSTFANVEILGFAAVLTIFAIAGKQICSLGVRDKSLNKLAIGIGMVPRGEVGLIVANIGRGLKAPDGEPIISADTFSAAVIMVVITTMITPPALKWAMERKPAPEAA